jgi:hypothetical protein
LQRNTERKEHQKDLQHETDAMGNSKKINKNEVEVHLNEDYLLEIFLRNQEHQVAKYPSETIKIGATERRRRGD